MKLLVLNLLFLVTNLFLKVLPCPPIWSELNTLLINDRYNQVENRYPGHVIPRNTRKLYPSLK